MAWSWAKKEGAGRGAGDPWSLEQPANKKRRLGLGKTKGKEAGGPSRDDWGDDSLELTQAELEEMDMMMSQQVTEPEQPGSSKPSAQGKIDPSVMKPPELIGAPARKSTTSSSTDSSSTSHQPSSLSSRMSNGSTSSSLSSHSSIHSVTDTSRKMNEEMKKALDEKYRIEGENKFLRETLHKQEAEMEKLRAERDELTDIQKQAQTEKEHQLQLQLESISSQAHFTQKELEDQIRALTQKVKNLQQQSEANPITSSPRQPSPRKVVVRPSPPSKAKLLNLQQHQQQKGEEVQSSQQFPTRLSFMEQINPTTSGASPTVKSVKLSTAACQTETMTDSPQKKGQKDVQSKPKSSTERNLKLKISQGKDSTELSGNEVVGHLLQCSGSSVPSSEGQGQSWDPGLTGLLHSMSTPLTLAALTYRRGQESAHLSPVKPRRVVSDSGSYTVVSRAHFRLAIEGLTKLLGITSTQKEQENANNAEDGDRLNNNTEIKTAGRSKDKNNKAQSITTKSESSTLDTEKSVASHLLLPLLTDYLKHYLDMVQSGSKRALSSSATYDSPKPGTSLDMMQSQIGSLNSTDSSLDSLSSLMLELLQDGRVYAISVEQFALSSLRALHALVLLCPSLAKSMLSDLSENTNSAPRSKNMGVLNPVLATTSSSSDYEVGIPPVVKKRISGTDADDENSTSSSEPRVIVRDESSKQTGANNRKPSCEAGDLFLVLVKLAGQDLEEVSSNPVIVQEALKVLTVLCEHCKEEHIHKFSSILTQGVFYLCFKQTRSIPVIVCAQRLLSSMARSEKLLSQVCTKSDICPLYAMYMTCSRRFQEESERILFAEMYKSHIWSLTAIIGHQSNNLSHIINSPCACSNELVVSVIMAMEGLYNSLLPQSSHPVTTATPAESHQNRTPPHSEEKRILEEMLPGVTLLVLLVQGDAHFARHRARVRLQYVKLLSDLATMMRANMEDWETHLMALEDFCDFEPDLSDTSQEAESEGSMDQT